jgi:anaerobic glycerol-3-phosphate dehydrogenase
LLGNTGRAIVPPVSNRADVVVIGGGIAGAAAALAAAGRGAQVLLIRAAPGASALCMGGWTGVLPQPLAQAFSSADHSWSTVEEVLPLPDGSVRRFDYAAASHAAARLTPQTMVCGIAGLAGFQAKTLAMMWGEVSGALLNAAEIVLPHTPPSGWSTAALATRLEQSCAALAHELTRALRATRASSIILPAVLGVTRSDVIRRTLESEVGCAIAEALGHTPSIPGWRLQKALDRMIGQANVRVLNGRVMDRSSHGTKLTGLTVQSNGSPQHVEGNAYVLATGKFVGGGITASEVLRDSALDCPIWIDHLGERFERVEPLTLTNADRREEQPLLSAGIQTDAENRPLDAHATLIFENVWVAGAVRAGVDGGLGRAATEGWAAGERASQ